jgi:flagellar protein FliO/FliZ
MRGEGFVTSWKKWIVLFTVLLIVFKMPITVVHASEKTVYDNFHKNKQQDNNLTQKQAQSTPSMGLYVFQFIGSFLLIIGLLFFVLKYVSRKSKILQGGGVFHAIGGHSFGNHRSLQMLMIGDTLYILGVGDSVNLIRTIPPGEEQTKLLESVAVTPLDSPGKWKWEWKWKFPARKTTEEKWSTHLIEQLKEVQSNQTHNHDQS